MTRASTLPGAQVRAAWRALGLPEGDLLVLASGGPERNASLLSTSSSCLFSPTGGAPSPGLLFSSVSSVAPGLLSSSLSSTMPPGPLFSGLDYDRLESLNSLSLAGRPSQLPVYPPPFSPAYSSALSPTPAQAAGQLPPQQQYPATPLLNVTQSASYSGWADAPTPGGTLAPALSCNVAVARHPYVRTHPPGDRWPSAALQAR